MTRFKLGEIMKNRKCRIKVRLSIQIDFLKRSHHGFHPYTEMWRDKSLSVTGE